MAKEHGLFELKYFDRDGQLMDEEHARNDMLNDGELFTVDVLFTGQQSIPSNYYLRFVSAAPAEEDGIADLVGEPSGGGYAPLTLPYGAVGFPSSEIEAVAIDGDYPAAATTKICTLLASGGQIGPMTHIVMCTDTKLITAAALSQSRTLADGESLQVQYKIKQT